MAVPKGKISKARRDKRRNSHWKLSLPGMTKCPKCGEMKLAHRMCKACGYYNGREVKSVKEAYALKQNRKNGEGRIAFSIFFQVSMKRLAFASRGTYRARLGYVPGANQRVLAGILICFLVSKATYMLRLFVNFLRKFY